MKGLTALAQELRQAAERAWPSLSPALRARLLDEARGDCESTLSRLGQHALRAARADARLEAAGRAPLRCDDPAGRVLAQLSPASLSALRAAPEADDASPGSGPSWTARSQKRRGGVYTERALIDLELHTRRALAAGTLRMRRVLRGCELRMSWTLNQRFAGQQLVWKLGAAQGPTVTGASKVKGNDEDELCDVRCVERKVTPKQQGYRFEARFRLTLGKRTYDLLLDLNVDLGAPDTRPALRYQANWRGPFGEGKGTLRDGFKRPGNRRQGNNRPGKRKGK